MATFVLNDEKVVNSYGFRVLNAGINLDRFKENPVLLAQHINNLWAVVGKWVNIRIKGSQLLADADFDLEDEDAAKIAGKVDRGFLKGCSMGFLPDLGKWSLEPSGTYVLEACELMEASIVAIPSNKTSVKLYAASGEILTEEQIKLTLPEQQEFSQIKNSNEMKKIMLSMAALTALGFTAHPNEDEAATSLSLSIEKLNKDLQDERAKNTELNTKLSAQAKAQATALVADAIKAGKLTAEVKEQFETMATDNYALAASILSAMPVKQSLAGAIVPNGGDPNASAVKTQDDFQKLSTEQQLAFKASHPEAYKSMFS